MFLTRSTDPLNRRRKHFTCLESCKSNNTFIIQAQNKMYKWFQTLFVPDYPDNVEMTHV